MTLRSRRNLLSITVSNTIAVTANALWIMFVPVYLASVGLPEASIALVFSLAALTTAALNPVGGRLSDMVGRKPVAVIGRLLTALGAFVVSLSTSASIPSSLRVVIVVTGYLVLNAGSGMRSPATSTILIESSDSQVRGRNYMIAERVFPSILPAITILIGATFFQAGEPGLMVILGSAGLLLSALVLEAFLDETLTSKDSQAEHTSGKGGVEVFLLLLIAAFVLDGASAKGVSWYVPVYLGEERIWLYGTLVSVSTLVIALFSYVSGLLVDRFGAGSSLVASWLLLAATVVLFSESVSPIWMLAFYSVWVALDTVDTSVPPIVIARFYSKKERATRLGIFRMAVNCSLFLGPLAAGLLVVYGARLPFYWKACMNVLAAAIVFVALRQKPFPQPAGGSSAETLGEPD
jgi:MFS family permease